MHYFDTSFLVPLLIPEAQSETVERRVRDLSQQEAPGFSEWGQLEFASVVARLVRMRQMQSEHATVCIDQLSRLLSHSFRMLVPEARDFRLAGDYLQQFDTGLRAGDALHLAIATNRCAQTIFTLDKGMIRAGRRLGLPVEGL
ncbi:MAG: type II toxin-antitoxin system VapC family toxin [Wenzhouxiangellaceae bacterium]|nr:type II toxin-antitoxin system VapC family toxin [Wenzhouxiangellaceae bacterium]